MTATRRGGVEDEARSCAAPASWPSSTSSLRTATISSSASIASCDGQPFRSAQPVHRLTLGQEPLHQRDHPPSNTLYSRATSLLDRPSTTTADHQPSHRHQPLPHPRCARCLATGVNYLVNSESLSAHESTGRARQQFMRRQRGATQCTLGARVPHLPKCGSVARRCDLTDLTGDSLSREGVCRRPPLCDRSVRRVVETQSLGRRRLCVVGTGGIVAVLFSDIVRSTELWSSLGGADAEALRSRHHHACVAAVEQAGGSVVKNLGDGLMATFPTVSAALDAAVGLQQTTAVVGRATSTTALELRVGLALGEAWTENGDWFGVPVVEAARLCAAAQPGQILVADNALTFVRGSSHKWSSVGLLTLKGLPDPVSASAVRWDDTTRGTVPLPPLVQHHRSDLAFVGRADAMRILLDANAQSRRVHLVVVTGEPGIGKTRLVSELAREVHAEGAIVLAGSCDESSIVPYQPFTEAFRFLAPRRPTSEVPKALACLIPAVAQDLGAPEAGDSPFDRLALADGVVEWLVSLAVTAPVVLILDDLHWASLETLNLVRHVVKSADDERILIVATYRDTDLDRAHPLANALADWRRLGQTPRVSLTGLGATDVEDLLRAQGGGELDDDGRRLAAALHAETEGNAYFVDQVLAYLIETGRLGPDGERWTHVVEVAELGLPQGVREVVGRRLSQLSTLANELLSLAAVAGRTFDPEVVRTALSSRTDDVLDALDEAVSAQLIREESDAVNRYAFTHSLVRQTLLDEVGALRRARLHQRIASAIEECYPADDPGHAAEVTSHLLEAAAVGELDRAIDLLLANRSRFDPATQLELAERALVAADELGTDPTRLAGMNIVVAENSAHRHGRRRTDRDRCGSSDRASARDRRSRAFR